MMILHANLLVSLVNDKVDMDSIERGDFYPKNQIFRIRELLDFISVLFEPQIELFDNELNVYVDEFTMPKEFVGDSFRMK